MAAWTKEELWSKSFVLVEIFGKIGLFSDIRVNPEDLPSGLYKYDLQSYEGEIPEVCVDCKTKNCIECEDQVDCIQCIEKSCKDCPHQAERWNEEVRVVGWMSTFILVNHFGTVIFKEELPLDDVYINCRPGHYFENPDDEPSFIGVSMTLAEYINCDAKTLSAIG